MTFLCFVLFARVNLLCSIAVNGLASRERTGGDSRGMAYPFRGMIAAAQRHDGFHNPMGCVHV